MKRYHYIEGKTKPKYKATFQWRRDGYGLRYIKPIHKQLEWIIKVEKVNGKFRITMDIRKRSMMLHVVSGDSKDTLREGIKEAERLYKNTKKRF